MYTHPHTSCLVNTHFTIHTCTRKHECIYLYLQQRGTELHAPRPGQLDSSKETQQSSSGPTPAGKQRSNITRGIVDCCITCTHLTAYFFCSVSSGPDWEESVRQDGGHVPGRQDAMRDQLGLHFLRNTNINIEVAIIPLYYMNALPVTTEDNG